MATRFLLPAEGSGAPAVLPAFDVGWEQTGQATRLRLLRNTRLETRSTLANTGTRTVPITTTQDILATQFVSDPIRPQRITGTIGYVGRVLQSATTANVTLAIVLRVLSQDGTEIRGTLLTAFGTDTAYPTVDATRRVNNAALTPVTTKPGDRLVLEVGGRATAPTAAGTYTARYGTSAATDFALTSGLTTDLNPWLELSQDIWDSDLESHRYVAVGGGMSATERWY